MRAFILRSLIRYVCTFLGLCSPMSLYAQIFGEDEKIYGYSDLVIDVSAYVCKATAR